MFKLSETNLNSSPRLLKYLENYRFTQESYGHLNVFFAPPPHLATLIVPIKVNYLSGMLERIDMGLIRLISRNRS